MLELQLPVGAGPSYIQLCNQISCSGTFYQPLDTSKDRGSVTSLEVSSAPDYLFLALVPFIPLTAGTQNPEGIEVFCLSSLLLLSSPANTEMLNTQTAFWEC